MVIERPERKLVSIPAQAPIDSSSFTASHPAIPKRFSRSRCCKYLVCVNPPTPRMSFDISHHCDVQILSVDGVYLQIKELQDSPHQRVPAQDYY